jgi:DNA-binding response OmpR family regulator
VAIKILVIDDDDAVLDFLRQKLGREFTVSTLTDARKAVESAHALQPEVVLCDIDMPHVNGAEVAAAFGKDAVLGKVPFLFMTNVLSPGEVAGMGGQVGGHRSISKRAPVAELIAGIKAALAR